MQTGQSTHSCLRREVPADHEAHSRSGDSCEESQRLRFGGSAPRRPKRGKPDHGNEPRSPHTQMLRADSCRAATWDDLRHKAGREEGPLWTIAGNQAEQGLTKGAVRRLRYRLSRHRLQQRGVPGDAQAWPQTRHGGAHDQPEDNAFYTRSARR